MATHKRPHKKRLVVPVAEPVALSFKPQPPFVARNAFMAPIQACFQRDKLDITNECKAGKGERVTHSHLFWGLRLAVPLEKQPDILTKIDYDTKCAPVPCWREHPPSVYRLYLRLRFVEPREEFDVVTWTQHVHHLLVRVLKGVPLSKTSKDMTGLFNKIPNFTRKLMLVCMQFLGERSVCVPPVSYGMLTCPKEEAGSFPEPTYFYHQCQWVFPALYVTLEQAQAIREALLLALITEYGERLPPLNCWEDVLDARSCLPEDKVPMLGNHTKLPYSSRGKRRDPLEVIDTQRRLTLVNILDCEGRPLDGVDAGGDYPAGSPQEVARSVLLDPLGYTNVTGYLFRGRAEGNGTEVLSFAPSQDVLQLQTTSPHFAWSTKHALNSPRRHKLNKRFRGVAGFFPPRYMEKLMVLLIQGENPPCLLRRRCNCSSGCSKCEDAGKIYAMLERCIHNQDLYGQLMVQVVYIANGAIWACVRGPNQHWCPLRKNNQRKLHTKSCVLFKMQMGEDASRRTMGYLYNVCMHRRCANSEPPKTDIVVKDDQPGDLPLLNKMKELIRLYG